LLKQNRTTNNPVKLSPDSAFTILRSIPDTQLQGRRMFEYLSQRPETPTGILSAKCSIGNLSDIAHYVNPYIYQHKLMIGCDKPERALINKFGDATNQFLWSIYEINADDGIVMPAAANDDNFNPVDNLGVNRPE